MLNILFKQLSLLQYLFCDHFQHKRQSYNFYKDREKIHAQMKAARTGKKVLTDREMAKVRK